MKEVKIYKLVDPRNYEVKYIGKTINSLEYRLYKHITDKPLHNTHKHNWIQSLIILGLKPNIELVEICDESNWKERERYWIKYYNNLTNNTTGGENEYYFTEEIKEKISTRIKNAWISVNYRNNISEKRKEYWSNPENRKSHGDKLRNKPLSDEHKEKISLNRKDNKSIMVNGVEYRSIKNAVKNIPIHRPTLKRRLLSEKYPNYFYIKKGV